MRLWRLAIAGALVAGFLTDQAFAEPEVCRVIMRSPEAGRLELSKTILPTEAGRAEGFIDSIWSPAAFGSSVNVLLSYHAADGDKSIGNVDGVEIEFVQPPDTTADQFTGQLVVDGMAPFPLDHAGVIMGPDHDAFGFVLDASLPSDRAVGHLLGQGARAKVLIFRADRVLQSEMFEGTQMSLLALGEPKVVITDTIDTTAIAARDKLFAQAAPSIVQLDPQICTPLRYESGVLAEAAVK